jgi:uncharacterized protein
MAIPASVVVRRRVKAGSEAAYEAWLTRLSDLAHREAPGYLGADFLRPGPAGGEYRSVLRFDDLANLEAFEASELRQRMLDEAAPLFAADAVREQMTGLELWFDPPPGTVVPQPSPHRMALVLATVVFILAYGMNVLLGPLTVAWPTPVRVLVFATLQVVLMTYLIMPRLSRLLARFIYPRMRTGRTDDTATE